MNFSWGLGIMSQFKNFQKIYFDYFLYSTKSFHIPWPNSMFFLSPVNLPKSPQSKTSQQTKQGRKKPIRQTNKQINKAKTKQNKKLHSVCFSLTDYSGAWNLPLSVGGISNDLPLKKTESFSPAGFNCK